MNGLFELARFGLTAVVMLGLKLGLTHGLLPWLHPLAAYLIVQVILTGISYALHARFTFRQQHSLRSFSRYARVIVLFQILDYLLFAVLLEWLQWDTTFSILSATVVIFLVRFLAVRRSFRASPTDSSPSSAHHA